MIKKLTIKHYKGFYDKQVVDFAVPDEKKKGSGLTIIVGPNNTGKTTIIESVFIESGKKFKETERHLGFKPEITIADDVGKVHIFSNIREGSLVEVDTPHNINLELIPSRRYWNYRFSGEWNSNQLRQQSAKQQIRGQSRLDIAPFFKTILKNKKKKKIFDGYMQKLIPHFTDWTIDTNASGQDYIKYKTKKGYHHAILLGDGVISLFRVVAHLVNNQHTTLVIDEPELSLHPASQKELIGIIAEIAKHKQVIISTHSPYFLRFEDLQNGAKITRTNKIQDEKCTVSCIDQKTLNEIENVSLKNKRKPYTLGIVAKEIFFTDKLVFLEGQEDVGILKHFVYNNKLSLNFDFFGYGTDGAGNIKRFLTLAKKLQIKAGAIFDKDKVAIADDCKNKFPDYKDAIKTISTDDIRDKIYKCPECGKKAEYKTGLFDEKGDIKGDKEETEVLQLISSLNDFFKDD